MAFNVAAESYDRFMGRFSMPLAPKFADFAGVRAGMKAIDVGSGPGALTAELVRRVGVANVAAVDPSQPFVEAARQRFPEVDVRQASAERLPHPDATFDAALAQLVVAFMKDPVAGIREMARVTRRGGTVAACMWDFSNDRGPNSPFYKAARSLYGDVPDEKSLAGVRSGQLRETFRAAGLTNVVEQDLTVSVRLATFEDYWQPFLLGVGPAGAYAKSLAPDRLERVRERCREQLGDGPLTIVAAVWAARGSV